jgi:hypothetical protein
MGLNMWVSLFNKAGLQPELVDKFEFNLQADGKEIPESYLIFILEKTRGIHETGTAASGQQVSN